MRMRAFLLRCMKEILRDPINLFFGLGFPMVLLFLLSAIQANIPVALFEIERLAPGITVFGLSFMTLFAATLVARDRETAFMDRLYTTPLTAVDFIGGYTLSLLPIAIAQAAICYVAAFLLGLSPSVNVLVAILCLIPGAVFFISLGLLLGSMLTVKQAGGIAGALVTNLTAWLSGVWFDIELVGGVFLKIAKCLPFVHAVEIEKSAVAGALSSAAVDFAVVIPYAIAVFVLAVAVFVRQMKK